MGGASWCRVLVDGRNQRADMGQMWERWRGDIPRLSYSWEDMQTEALFWAGKAKFDSRIGAVL